MARRATATIILTERDVDVLLSLYKYRYLSTGQIERLHFPSSQTATRRLRLLATDGYVSLFRSPGVEERLVMLGPLGPEVVAERLLVPLSELGWNGRRTQPKDHFFLKHFLAVSDFRIALTEACERAGIRLLGFIPEHVGAEKKNGSVQKYIRDVISDIEPPRGKVSHTPDGVFALERDGNAALFFLEVDRGTEVLTHPERGVLRTLRFYLNYLTSGGYQRYREDFGVGEGFKGFRVLFVTTSETRVANIRTVGGRTRFEPEDAKRFIWLTTQRTLQPDTLLGPVWQALDPADTAHYAIVT